MASLKSLASQTVIYGLTTILARVLNFALTPLHTKLMVEADYGIINDLYSMVAFLMVVLTFGMETAFFRFYRDSALAQRDVFSHTTGFSLLMSSLVIALGLFFLEPLSAALRFEDSPHLLKWMLLIVAMDAVAAVPFAKLRAEHRPYRFLFIRLTTIFINVSLNLFFFLAMPYLVAQGQSPQWLVAWYEPGQWVSYVLLANLLANGLMILLFLPEFRQLRWRPQAALMRKLLLYASPLVIGFLAGIANEKGQYQFLKYLLPEEAGREAMGLFGAMAKIATFMMLFIQAFRFAAEPFFFNGEGDFKDKMARVMRYFVVLQSIIFLGLVCFTELLQWSHFIDPKYWKAWGLAPILLFANLLLGINFNLNIWYKLGNKTRYGAYISFTGLGFMVISSALLIPRYAHYGAAWATLISYGAMTAFSFYLNQKHEHTAYPVRALSLYLALSVLGAWLSFSYFQAAWLPGLIIFGLYLTFLLWREGPALKLAFKK